MDPGKEARLQTAKTTWETVLAGSCGPPKKARITAGLARIDECLDDDIEPTEEELVTFEGHWAEIQWN